MNIPISAIMTMFICFVFIPYFVKAFTEDLCDKRYGYALVEFCFVVLMSSIVYKFYVEFF